MITKDAPCQDFSDRIKELFLLYEDGKISKSEYYDKLTNTLSEHFEEEKTHLTN